MKRTLTYITLGILLPLFSSCIFDEVIETENVSNDVMFTFTLDVNSQPVTKADDFQWNDSGYDQDAGTDFEKRININDLLVFAYDDKGEYLDQLPILKRSKDNGVVKFLCGFNDTKIILDKPAKLVILANCVNDKYRLSFSGNLPQLNNLKFTAPTDLINGYIPMIGLKNFEIEYENGKVKQEQDLGAVTLLRALAKVGVSLSEELKADGFSISTDDNIPEIKLNYARSTGYSLPNTWDIRYHTSALYHEDAFRPTSSSYEVVTGLNAFGKDNNGGYYIYVPETENGLDSKALSLAITVEKDGKEYEFDYDAGIKFCEYENGQPEGAAFDIMRNHYYDFVVTSVKTGLEFNLNVAEWIDAPVWDLDFSAPIHSKLMTSPSAEAGAPTEVPTVRYDNTGNGENGAFVGYFMMESPAGMTWRPTLANASSTDYEVRVYTTDTVNPEYDVLVKVDAIEAAGKFYKIVVVAKNPNNVGNVVKLGLTYTADWNPEATPLLIINKGESGCYYPWDGTDPDDQPDMHWISIKQI